MKKLAFLPLALGLLLSACGSGGSDTVPPYRVSLTNLGYEQDETGKITIPSVTANVVSSAGAPDIRKLEYTAVLLNGSGEPQADLDSKITPLNGLLFANARGGYRCNTTPEGACTMTSADALMVDNGAWTANTISRALVPGEWAIAHVSGGAGTAAWSVDFTFTALQSNGRSVSWKQNYQFISPAK